MDAQRYDNAFKNHLPDTLFLSHYQLAEKFPESTANEWRQYLKDNEHFITSETAAIAEAQARNALNLLGKGATTQEVSAIKALLEKSKLINDAQKQQQHVLLTYLPNKTNKNHQNQTNVPTPDQPSVNFLRDYQKYTVHLALSGHYDAQKHTEEWFRQFKAEMGYTE